jgi:hypothetical protein
MTFDTGTGNIGLGNLIVGSTSNITSAQRINTIAPFSGVLGNATTFGNAQVVMGNGYFGSLNYANVQAFGGRGAKLTVWDSAYISDSGNIGIRTGGIASNQQIILNGNIANTNNSSAASVAGILQIGGGSSGNTWLNNTATTAVTALQGISIVGTGGTVALGNTTVGIVAGTVSRVSVNTGSTINTALGVTAGIQGSGYVANAIAVSAQFNSSNATLAPVKNYGFYMGYPAGNALAIGGITNNNASRLASEYYFLRNDDPVAQNQIGTLRSYNEFNSVSATSSGALIIDKAVSQVHQVNLSGNITSVTYANMISSLSDSVNTDEEVDTVTIVFNQGSVGGYSVAFPTGATYKYAGGTNTIATTVANSVTLVAVTVVRIGGTATYLTTISPGFV